VQHPPVDHGASDLDEVIDKSGASWEVDVSEPEFGTEPGRDRRVLGGDGAAGLSTGAGHSADVEAERPNVAILGHPRIATPTDSGGRASRDLGEQVGDVGTNGSTTGLPGYTKIKRNKT